MATRHTSPPSGSSSWLSQKESHAKAFRVDRKQHESTSRSATWKVEKKVGHYSVDENYAVKWDSSGIRYLTPEKCFSQSVDLYSGFTDEAYEAVQSKRDRYDASYSISQLINWMKRNEEKLSDKPNFVIKRGILKKIVMSTYNARKSWEMEAVIHDGVIYVSKPGVVNKDSERAADRRQKQAAYGGLKFEGMATRKSNPESSSEKFYSIVSGMLTQASQFDGPSGSLRFLLSAEIDAIDGSDAQACESAENYVEIKTSFRPMTKPGGRREFGFFKLLDWWNHCHLAGIPRIFIGIRNDVGTLEDIIFEKICAIPGIDALERNRKACMGFFFAFFTWVQQVVEREGTVYEFSFDPQKSSIVKYREIREPDHPFLLLFEEST